MSRCWGQNIKFLMYKWPNKQDAQNNTKFQSQFQTILGEKTRKISNMAHTWGEGNFCHWKEKFCRDSAGAERKRHYNCSRFNFFNFWLKNIHKPFVQIGKDNNGVFSSLLRNFELSGRQQWQLRILERSAEDSWKLMKIREQ